MKLFLENKGHPNPRECVRKHAYAYSCFRLVYSCVCLCTHAKVPETMKDKFYALKLRFRMNLTSSRSRSKPLFFFFQYKKLYMVHFQNTQKILRENIKFTRISKSKREFFTKHPQVNFLLIETFSGLDLQVLKFTNQFCLIVNRFD